ncbi:Sulfotransferase domain protein [Gemmata obscuriglobus]|uniref:Sulfotransferase domain-containing protein n=1 Tax=Gemmata obscuriglobus TaxID=114 RepID=A0A2Z3GVH0_9BACT|nr:sulfotransferase [Gemmata obscuriglobus]AWM36541.1 hypothetical protein C1280_05555 [Gemmata obscuriglobus]QEG30834.1 Sulfotransferase domain protein [Gemmata obscuriglobus]VTS10165.1 sulfotransferase domain protein : Sulfotransferase OS=Fulvivirga imtechensis AK7 GN=C900_03017 PE=4 SV=1: Sulfotransfer_1 [Gemmata obscuriglobus UQM 2246]
MPTDPHHLFRYRRPDFLVISPPKTGSTWLADNLRRHPDLFVPEVKEVKYFSSLYKRLDFGWYCDHFVHAGSRRAGEASPSYAALPLARIRQIRELLPHVRLVFLMREPVARAWSHAKHNHRYCEANFAASGPGSATDEQWRTNFSHDWPLVGGDYLGQLRRWSAVFPREQMFVGFYESIASRPADLLRAVLAFLGADPNVDLSGFPVADRILEGPPGVLPDRLAPTLRGLLRARTLELEALLRDRFELDVPPEWRAALTAPADLPAEPPAAFSLGAGDAYLAGVLAQEEVFATGCRFVLTDYRGHDVVFCRGGLYAVAQPADPRALLDDVARERLIAAGACLTAPTLAELKERITDRVLSDAARHRGTLEHALAGARADIARLGTQVAELNALAAELAAVARRPSLARRVLHRVRRAAPVKWA